MTIPFLGQTSSDLDKSAQCLFQEIKQANEKGGGLTEKVRCEPFEESSDPSDRLIEKRRAQYGLNYRE